MRCWEIAHFPTPQFFTDFNTGHEIIRDTHLEPSSMTFLMQMPRFIFKSIPPETTTNQMHGYIAMATRVHYDDPIKIRTMSVVSGQCLTNVKMNGLTRASIKSGSYKSCRRPPPLVSQAKFRVAINFANMMYSDSICESCLLTSIYAASS